MNVHTTMRILSLSNKFEIQGNSGQQNTMKLMKNTTRKTQLTLSRFPISSGFKS